MLSLNMKALHLLGLILTFFGHSPASLGATGPVCFLPPKTPVIQNLLRARGNLAKCPPSSGFSPLTQLHPATSVVVGYRDPGSSTPLIQALANWSLKRDPVTPTPILVPGISPEEARKTLPAELSAPPYSSFVVFMETDGPVSWAQDMMEAGVSGRSPRPTLLDLPVYNTIPGDVPASLGERCGIPVIPQERIGFEDEPDSSSTGGNIEALPGGRVVVGKAMETNLKRFLKNQTGRAPLELDLEWLDVGHVDEVLLVLPSPQSRCGFALGYASPALAIDLLRKSASQDPQTPIEPVESKAANAPDPRPSPPPSAQTDCLLLLASGGAPRPLTTGWALGCEKLVALNLEYGKKIQSGVRKVSAQVSRDTGCSDPELVALPVFFQPEETDFVIQGKISAGSASPNAVNSLVLDRTVFVPSQPHPGFQKEIESRLHALGLEVVFVDSGSYHFGHGHIHCATQAIRTCAP